MRALARRYHTGLVDSLAAFKTAIRAGTRLGVNLLLTPDNVRDLRPTLDEVVALGARGVTLLRPEGDWAAAHWPGSMVLRLFRNSLTPAWEFVSSVTSTSTPSGARTVR